VWLLEAGYLAAASRGAMDAEMAVVSDAVVVDVDFTARHKLHTGIQRVVRETVPHWARDHEITLVVWTDQDGALRFLDDREADRVLRWSELDDPGEDRQPSTVPHRLVVPVRSTVVLPEIAAPEHCSPLAAVARFSGNRVTLIGHDCIPVISPEIIHPELPDRFTRFLETVKHAHRVAAVSRSAAGEFRGFADMVTAQGLTGPAVVPCVLPVESPPGEPLPQADPPLVVSVGSFEPRKNQLAVLTAAERLWRAGLRFQMVFMGGGGWVTEADALMNRLVAEGRPIQRFTAVSDEQMWQALRQARFSVFLSLHEGYGLPVAESLACGTPSLTTAYGSTREIADGGGAIAVDPLDDDAVAAQMQRLLTDDALIERLRTEAGQRPPRTWEDYAREVWRELVTASGASGEERR
jgi:glycosyltransferase involved in cell wall biosynthesis